MPIQTKVVDSFPSVSIPSLSGGVPVEVSLIAQLGRGAGSHLVASVSARQRRHDEFIDELDEPSAKLGGVDFERGDPTALYSFVVGPKGHPFHRHAGHRMFTAISGSGGAQLRFSTASKEQTAADPESFIQALSCVNIPPDCLFTVRFGGETWHQFAPMRADSAHPVFFALSCHTNELGGDLSAELRERVVAGKASIPALTELLPKHLEALLERALATPGAARTLDVSLDAPPGTAQRAMCGAARGGAGRALGLWGAWRGSRGFVSVAERGIDRRRVAALKRPLEGSLLLEQFADKGFDHEDAFGVTLGLDEIGRRGASAQELLALVLEGFLAHPPTSVARMMAFRNALARPIGLRVSPLGCPVSSLLSKDRSRLFAGQFPVLDQRVDPDGARAQVILGADDKHLRFRACVGVEILEGGQARVTLGSRVKYLNLFGRLYMASIHLAHIYYVTPTMLSRAVASAAAPGDKRG